MLARGSYLAGWNDDEVNLALLAVRSKSRNLLSRSEQCPCTIAPASASRRPFECCALRQGIDELLQTAQSFEGHASLWKEHDHHLLARSRIRNRDYFHAIARVSIGRSARPS